MLGLLDYAELTVSPALMSEAEANSLEATPAQSSAE